MPNCLHCERRKPARGKRGLCFACYVEPAVRALYPRRAKYDVEPTEAELDAMIAEQMKCLPSWWHDESRLVDGEFGYRHGGKPRGRYAKRKSKVA